MKCYFSRHNVFLTCHINQSSSRLIRDMKGRITKTLKRAEILPFHATIMPKGKCFGGQRSVELYYCIWIVLSFVYLEDLQ